MEDPNGYLPPPEAQLPHVRALSQSPTRQHGALLPPPAGRNQRWSAYQRDPVVSYAKRQASLSPTRLRDRYAAPPPMPASQASYADSQASSRGRPTRSMMHEPAGTECAAASAASSPDKQPSAHTIGDDDSRAADPVASGAEAGKAPAASTHSPAHLDIPFHFPGISRSDAPTPNLVPRGRQVTFRSGEPSELNSMRKKQSPDAAAPPSSNASSSAAGGVPRSTSRKTLSDALSHSPLFNRSVRAESSHGSVMPTAVVARPVFSTPEDYYTKDTSQLDVDDGIEDGIQESPYFAIDTHALDSHASSASNIAPHGSLPGADITLAGIGMGARGAQGPLRKPASVPEDSPLPPAGSGTSEGKGWSGYQPPPPPHLMASGGDNGEYVAGTHSEIESSGAHGAHSTAIGKRHGLADYQAGLSTAQDAADVGLRRHLSGFAKAAKLKTQASLGLGRSASVVAHTPVVQEDVALIMELQCASAPLMENCDCTGKCSFLVCIVV